MTEIFLCNRPYSTDTLKSNYDIQINPYFQYTEEQQKQIDTYRIVQQSYACSTSPFKPYPVGAQVTNMDRRIAAQLSNPKVAKNLTDFATTFGADTTMALSEMRKKLDNAGFGGENVINASGGLYSGKVDKFLEAVKKYQEAVLEYRELVQSKSSKTAIKTSQQKVNLLHRDMQIRFQKEMNVVNANVKASGRGTALSSSTRATNIARSSRNSHFAKLDIQSQVQANNLVKFSQHAKHLGNGLAAIDFTSRGASVIQTYKNDGDWNRELFVQSMNFGAAAGAGYITGKVAVGLVLTLSPVGWIAIIATAAVVVGTSIGAATYAGNFAESRSNSWWDRYLAWLH